MLFFSLLLLVPTLCLSSVIHIEDEVSDGDIDTDMEDEVFDREIDTDMEDEFYDRVKRDLDARLGRPDGKDVVCGRWTNVGVDITPTTKSEFRTSRGTERCTAVFQPVKGCKEIKMTCKKFFVDNRDAAKCDIGDTFTTKPEGPSPRVYCKRDGPTESYPVISPRGNLKIWYKRSIGILGKVGRYPSKGVICDITCNKS